MILDSIQFPIGADLAPIPIGIFVLGLIGAFAIWDKINGRD